jgi:hypothetical protein
MILGWWVPLMLSLAIKTSSRVSLAGSSSPEYKLLRFYVSVVFFVMNRTS